MERKCSLGNIVPLVSNKCFLGIKIWQDKEITLV